jgi:hypothetical protein
MANQVDEMEMEAASVSLERLEMELKGWRTDSAEFWVNLMAAHLPEDQYRPLIEKLTEFAEWMEGGHATTSR